LPKNKSIIDGLIFTIINALTSKHDQLALPLFETSKNTNAKLIRQGNLTCSISIPTRPRTKLDTLFILSTTLSGNAVPKFFPCHNLLQDGQERPSTFNLGIYSEKWGK
jgi:hypothetical protein